jgi:hypothetical protein
MGRRIRSYSNFEGGAMGIPQIVPNIGGFRDFFDKDATILVG